MSGVVFYDVNGNEVDAVYGKRLNSVDLRYGFPLAGGTVDIVAV